MFEPLFINVIGEPASGKGEICNALVELGCQSYVPSTTIKTYATAHSIPLRNRLDFQAVHQRVIAEDSLGMIRPALGLLAAGDVVIEGLRVPTHVRRLREFGKVVTIAALCDSDEERFQRRLSNGAVRNDKDSLQFEQFVVDGQRELYNPNPDLASVRSVMAMADFTIDTLALDKSAVRSRAQTIYSLLA